MEDNAVLLQSSVRQRTGSDPASFEEGTRYVPLKLGRASRAGGKSAALRVSLWDGHVSFPLLLSMCRRGSPLPACLLALETVAQGRCLGGYRLQAQPTQAAAVASHWPTPQGEREKGRLYHHRHPWMERLSAEGLAGSGNVRCPLQRGA